MNQEQRPVSDTIIPRCPDHVVDAGASNVADRVGQLRHNVFSQPGNTKQRRGYKLTTAPRK